MPAPRPDAYVLAGGRSRRMGADKALATLRGRTFAASVVAALTPIAGRVWVVRRAGQAALPFPTLLEPDDEDHHPLLGVALALGHASTPHVVLAPVDVPLIRPELFAALLAAAPAVAIARGVAHPLVAVLPRDLAGRAAALARAGAPARALVDGLPRVEVDAEQLADLDTPEDVLSRGGP